MMGLVFLSLFFFFLKGLHGVEMNEPGKDRQGKFAGVFQVVRFPNANCLGSGGLNGTCYTESECTAKGGSASISCAAGFGICCIFSMSCGSTISQNNTYHVISNFNTVTDPSPCTYTVCPMNNNICKIRLDFETFTISGPATTTLNTADVIIGPSIGDCTTDSFTVTAPGSRSPPTICGLNTGQHMYLDSSSACNILSFNIDRATTVTRSWRVKVTQYDCGSDVPGIVEDCLQYFTGLSGTIRNFNYDTTKVDSALATANTHLSNQNYNICFRQERGFCSICFSPVITNSFSVSASGNDAEAQSAISSLCTGSGAYGDYIEVTNLNSAPVTPATLGIQRVCGNFFHSNPVGQTAGTTLCSAHVPFRWGVRFDDGEKTDDTTPETNLNAAENFDKGGMIGFNMNWFQVAC